MLATDFVQTFTKWHLVPFLQPPLALKRKQIWLAILGAVEGILGEFRLLVAILALAGLAFASALLAGLLRGGGPVVAPRRLPY